MTSTTVSQHTTQPLNFGPEWLRALSTPDSATSIPSSGGSGSGNIFKFSATKYRYSKDEILALRVNVSERLSEEIQNEILENLKDVENVFRPNILEPLALTAPTSEELTKMNALSSYISGRTPGGAGRAGNNSQQSQQDSRNNRGSSSMSNGRGGSSSRGRGGRDTTYGPNRGNNNNNNSDDNGENGNAGDETPAQSSSWSRSHHSRGASFGNRVRSYDDRDQTQPYRRGGTTRQSSDGWRRSRGDDDDNNEQGDDSSAPVNGSSSWTSRGGTGRRGSSNGSIEQRTKSNDKWNYNDDRSGSSSNYESSQQRGGGGGWRTNSSMSDRDLNSRRPQPKRDRMPEWMDDNNDDDDNHLNNATFEQDGTFTRSSAARTNSNDEQQQKSRSTSDESLSQSKTVPPQQEEETKPEKPIQQVDTAIVNVPTPSEPAVPQPKPLVQQAIPPWDDDFDQSHFAATLVEATLADDHDYSPPISAKPTPRSIPTEPTSVTAPIIPQQQRAPVMIDDKQWFYRDPQNTIQGPFSAADMERWFAAGYFTVHLPVKRLGETQFSTIQQLTKELGRLPFRNDVPSLPTTPVHKQQPIASEPQKFNPMAYVSSSSASNNPFLDDFSMQQQSRQNVQQHLLFNRQTSMPSSGNDRKPISSSSSMSSQLQAYFNSQQQQQQQQQHQSSSSSPLFSPNLSNDPAILFHHHLQRSMSSTNQPQQSNPAPYDDIQRSLRHLSSQTNNSPYYPSNAPLSQQQTQQSSNDIVTRLAQAMQSHGKEQRRVEQQQQRHDLELERLKLYQQAEQTRLQRDEEERRKYKLQQEVASNRQSNLDQLSKSMENKKQSSMEIDPFVAFQQSIQYQKEQQAKIEAQQAENIRRYQQQFHDQSMYQTGWNQQANTDLKPTLNFADLQKQEQEQDRRSREATAFAHPYAKAETLPNPSPSSTNKPNSWARTLFADSNNGNSNLPSATSHLLSDHNTNERTLPDSSSSSSYNQQATNAPKTRSATNQPSTPWNGSNASFQDIPRQQQQQQQQNTSTSSGWGGQFQSTSSGPYWDNQQPSTKPTTGWTELKPATSGKVNPTTSELPKDLSTNTRTQDALSKWTQNQFKDISKDIDVPTLVQLLKDIDNPGDIMEYVQPYIGSVSKAKEFANDFLAKRNRLVHAEPDLDNDRLNELVMAPTSSNDNSISGGDEGFQVASSNGQKKKAKKMKGQKLDAKQLGFVVNNRPEQRDDIEKVPM